MTSTVQQTHYAELDRQLRERRETVRAAIQSGLQAMGQQQLASEVGDLEDRALASWVQDLREADLRHDAQELADIDAALARMASDSYGVCVDCGDEIPLPRLRAYPTAKRCLACQEVHEKRKRAFG